MKSILITITLLASTSSFAMVSTPNGKYTALTCDSLNKSRSMNLRVAHGVVNEEIEMVLTSPDLETPIVYKNVVTKVSPRAGGPLDYVARVPGGRVTLSINSTTSPSSDGWRKATLTSQIYGKATTTYLMCKRRKG